MTDDREGMPWMPTMFAEQMQDASEQALETQREWFQRMMSAGTSQTPAEFSSLMGTAMFKTRVQSGGRISIPDAEREALDIEEGDIVQTIVIPVKRNRSDSDE